MNTDQHSFGVFKPVGHVVIAFPDAAGAAAAAEDFARDGRTGDELRRIDDREMLQAMQGDLERAGGAAKTGQEYNLAKANRDLAAQGHHFLVVRAEGGAAERHAAEVARRHGATRAQAYGRFIIEELIEPPGGLSQVAESPDRGLDAQTPDGLERPR